MRIRLSIGSLLLLLGGCAASAASGAPEGTPGGAPARSTQPARDPAPPGYVTRDLPETTVHDVTATVGDLPDGVRVWDLEVLRGEGEPPYEAYGCWQASFKYALRGDDFVPLTVEYLDARGAVLGRTRAMLRPTRSLQHVGYLASGPELFQRLAFVKVRAPTDGDGPRPLEWEVHVREQPLDIGETRLDREAVRFRVRNDGPDLEAVVIAVGMVDQAGNGCGGWDVTLAPLRAGAVVDASTPSIGKALPQDLWRVRIIVKALRR